MKKAKTVVVVWRNSIESRPELYSITVINSRGIAIELHNYHNHHDDTNCGDTLHQLEGYVLAILKANDYALDYYMVGDTAKCYNWQWIDVASGLRDSYVPTKWVY